MITPMLADFLKALREADLPISPAETLEAHQAIDRVGWADRGLLRDSLAVTLAKSESEKQRFDACFDRFFQAPEATPLVAPDAPDAADAAGSPDAESGAGAGSGEGETGEAGEGGASGGGEAAQLQAAGQLSALSRLLLENDRAGLAARMAEAVAQSGLREIVLFTQIGRFTRLIAEGMGLEALDADLAGLRAAAAAGDPDAPAAPGAAEQARRLNAGRAALLARLRDHVERQLALQAAGKGRRLREELLREISLSQIERRDYRIMQDLVRKMARKLVVLHSRRRKKSRRGQLDLRRTLRRNAGYDGVLIEPQWRRRKIARPDLHVLCDVSGSVANVARFLLIFLYSLQEVLPKVRAYAFAGELREVTALFAARPVEEAVAAVLEEFAWMPTDYGRALMDFRDLAMDDLDGRSTVLVLGDARSNNADPRPDILRMIHNRARRLIWLNPEGRSQWGGGDSEMPRYAPLCHQAEVCHSLKQLERVVDRMLRATL